MTIQGLPSVVRQAGTPTAKPKASVSPRAAPQPHTVARRVDLSQGRELGTRQWWRLYAGRLRHERKLFPCRLVQRILYKRKSGKEDDAAALLNYFFKTITVADGPACLTLARSYAKDTDHRADAIDLFRAAETAGAIGDVSDVLCMTQLLLAAGASAEAVTFIGGHQRVAPTDARLATWTGIAWLARACEVSSDRPEYFASAQERAVKSLRVAAFLSPSDPVLADNVAAAEALYPGPNFGNIARVFASPFIEVPELRAALVEALERRVNYTVQRAYAIGPAIRYDTKHHRRQENVDAALALQS